jgi:hypothetical protein
MKIGDADGLNVIYDKNGELILHEGEIVIAVDRNIEAWIDRGWGHFLKGFFPLRKGTLYRTNRRLVFIAEPSPSDELTWSTGALYEIPAQMYHERHLKQHGLKLYFEILYNELICRSGRAIYLFVNGRRYSISYSKNSKIFMGLLGYLPEVDKRIKSMYKDAPLPSPDIPHCDKCGSTNVFRLCGSDRGMPYGLGQCKVCRRTFGWKGKWPMWPPKHP